MNHILRILYDCGAEQVLMFYSIGLCDNGKSNNYLDECDNFLQIYLDKRYYLNNAVSKKFSLQCVQ